MNTIKKHQVFLCIASVIILTFIFVSMMNEKKHYSLSDFGIPPLLKSDCSSLKNVASNSPINLYFNAPDVSLLREKIKTIIKKYNGDTTSESYNSYPSAVPTVSSQDSVNITISFDKVPNEFVAEVSSVVKNFGGVDTGYSYINGNQPQYGSAYSPYTSCTALVQNLSADVLQLEVFTKALRGENNPGNISLLSQSISNTKTTLLNDVSSLNSFFMMSDKPTVSITINTLQK